MKVRVIVVTLSLLFLTLPFYLLAAPAQSIGESSGFAKKVSGTYVDQGEFLGGLITFTGTRTVSSDGTETATNSNCCGAAPANALGQGNLQSIGLGNWQRTGNMQITSTALIFSTAWDPDELGCRLGCPTDQPTVARITLVENFAADFQTITGTISTEIFLLDQDLAPANGILDYLDPDGVPVAGPIPGTFTSTRLPILD